MEKVVKSPHYNNFHFKKGVVNQVFLVGGWPHLQVFVDLASSSHGSGVFNWKAWKVKEVTRQAKGVVQNCQIGNHHRNPRRATSGQGFSKHDMQSPNHDLTTFATTDAAAKPRIQTSLSFLFKNSSVIPAFHFNFEDAPGSSVKWGLNLCGRTHAGKWAQICLIIYRLGVKNVIIYRFHLSFQTSKHFWIFAQFWHFAPIFVQRKKLAKMDHFWYFY